MCHGGADEKHNEFVIWSKKDFHTRAPATLTMARSARIAETLKIPDATTDARCTVCHDSLQAVPASRKGPLVSRAVEAVSCESCHNAAEPWILTHTRTDLTYQDKVNAGMRDLKNLYVRANTCVACHQNLEPEIRAAGHPELIFELDGQTVAMPRHWTETNRLRGAQAWFVGQAVALREGLAQLKVVPVAPSELAERAAALAAILRLAADTDFVDQEARNVAERDWSRADTREHLRAIASQSEWIPQGNAPSSQLPMRAERTVLALERLLVALNLHQAPALSSRLDTLFADVQSRPDFDAPKFARDLKAFHDAITPE